MDPNQQEIGATGIDEAQSGPTEQPGTGTTQIETTTEVSQPGQPAPSQDRPAPAERSGPVDTTPAPKQTPGGDGSQ